MDGATHIMVMVTAMDGDTHITDGDIQVGATIQDGDTQDGDIQVMGTDTTTILTVTEEEDLQHITDLEVTHQEAHHMQEEITLDEIWLAEIMQEEALTQEEIMQEEIMQEEAVITQPAEATQISEEVLL